VTVALPVRRSNLPTWSAVSPPRIPSTAWPALGWLVLFVVVVATSGDLLCAPADPCGPTLWWNVLETALLVGPVWVWLLPAAAVPLGVSLAAAWTAALVIDPVGVPLTVLLPCAFALGAWTVLVGVRHGHVADLLDAAPRAVWPGPAPDSVAHPARSAGLLVAGGLSLVSVLLVAWALVHGASEAAAEAAAERVQGTVVSHGEDGYLVELRVGPDVVELDTWGASAYPVGSVQPLLRTPDDLRLVAEPYDPGGWQVLGLTVGGLAVVAGARGRRRVGALRRLLTEPQPVLAVRLLGRGDAVLLAADDVHGEGPALASAPLLWWSEGEPEDDDPEDDVLPTPVPVLATAYGVPLPGGAVAVVTDDGTPLLPYDLCGRPPRDLRFAFAHVDVDGGGVGGAAPAAEPPGHAADPRAEVLRPPAWRAALGWVLLLGGLAGCASVVAWDTGPWSTAWRLLVVLNLGVGGLLDVASRVDIDRAGVRVRGPLRVRSFPWRALAGADVVEGSVVLLTRSDELVVLPWPRSGWQLRRRASRDLALREAADGLQAQIHLAGPSRADAGRDVVGEQGCLVGLWYAVAVLVCLAAGLTARIAQ